jgi:hypothetical protein
MSDLSVIATNMEEILVKMPTTLISPELEDTDMMDERLRTMAHVDRANDDLYGRWSGVAQRSWYIERGEPLKGIIQVELLENTLPVAMFIGEYVQPGKALPTRIHIGGKGRDIAEDIMKRVRVMLNVLREEYISTELADREYIAEFDKSRDNITITNRKVHYTIKDIPKIDTRSVREFEVSMPVEEQANIEVTEIGGDIKVINIQETMMTGGAPIEDTDIGDEYNEDIELEAEEYNEDGAEDNENGEMDNNPEISEEKIDLNIAE